MTTSCMAWPLGRENYESFGMPELCSVAIPATSDGSHDAADDAQYAHKAVAHKAVDHPHPHPYPTHDRIQSTIHQQTQLIFNRWLPILELLRRVAPQLAVPLTRFLPPSTILYASDRDSAVRCGSGRDPLAGNGLPPACKIELMDPSPISTPWFSFSSPSPGATRFGQVTATGLPSSRTRCPAARSAAGWSGGSGGKNYRIVSQKWLSISGDSIPQTGPIPRALEPWNNFFSGSPVAWCLGPRSSLGPAALTSVAVWRSLMAVLRAPTLGPRLFWSVFWLP
ncbi:hypothetical protein B0J13DRAFT_135628 [Dactylonectria estremocensis]|uniref:Uncharacterized protein n=1 Tax=Dactylonectria estremocensis TaxID=1079267 RepID=A0A9P9INP9_9HYPO|nr:hypothetical protein B0J13DRAFT_135628 [Dactylonectria estremocensis]